MRFFYRPTAGESFLLFGILPSAITVAVLGVIAVVFGVPLAAANENAVTESERLSAGYGMMFFIFGAIFLLGASGLVLIVAIRASYGAVAANYRGTQVVPGIPGAVATPEEIGGAARKSAALASLVLLVGVPLLLVLTQTTELIAFAIIAIVLSVGPATLIFGAAFSAFARSYFRSRAELAANGEQSQAPDPQTPGQQA